MYLSHLQHNTAQLRLGWASPFHRTCAQLLMCSDLQIFCVTKKKEKKVVKPSCVHVNTWNGEFATFELLLLNTYYHRMTSDT